MPSLGGETPSRHLRGGRCEAILLLSRAGGTLASALPSEAFYGIAIRGSDTYGIAIQGIASSLPNKKEPPKISLRGFCAVRLFSLHRKKGQAMQETNTQSA